MGSRVIIPWTPPALVAERGPRAGDAVVIDLVEVLPTAVIPARKSAGARLYESICKLSRYGADSLHISI